MNAAGKPSTIVLKAHWNEGGVENEEGIASGALLPGMNVGMGAAAESIGRFTYAVAATDNTGTGTGTTGGRGNVRVVKEDAMRGLTTLDAYASGDNVFVHDALPGDHIQVLVASGQNVAKGAGLSAATTGKWSVDTTLAAVEALESSGGALAADTLLRARVI